MDRLSHFDFACSLAHNGLQAEGAKYLAEALNVNSSMTFVDLSSNCLCGIDEDGDGEYDSTGIKAIAEALSVSSSMTSLK